MGVSGARVNTIDFITIATLGNALDFGDATQLVQDNPGTSSPTRGVFMGGTTPSSPNRTNTIEYITIAQTGNALDFGDLTLINGGVAAYLQRSRRTLNITMESNI